MCARIRQRDDGGRMAQQVDHSVFVDIEQLTFEFGLEVIRQTEIEGPVSGVFARVTGELADDLAD